MILRRGFTMLELVIVVAIFIFALSFVFFNFRNVDERESLKRLSLAAAGLATQAQTWTIGNHYDAGVDAADGAGNGIPPYGYALQVGRTPNPNWEPRVIGIVEFGTSYNFVDVATLDAEVRLADLEVAQLRVLFDDPDHCTNMSSGQPPIRLTFRPPNGTAEVLYAASTNNPIRGSAFVYFRHVGQNVCRRLSVFASGQVSETEVACPAACTGTAGP